MIETREKTINGNKIEVTQFPARHALRYKCRLLRIIGPTIGALFENVKNLDEVKFTDQDLNIGAAVKALVDRLDESEVLDLIIQLCQSTRFNGKEMNTALIDSEFSGNLTLLYKIIYFILEVNFADFFFEKGGIGMILGSQVMKNNTVE